jgi:hypothetical protein
MGKDEKGCLIIEKWPFEKCYLCIVGSDQAGGPKKG